MQHETVVLKQLDAEDALAWTKHVQGQVSVVRRVIHLYVVNEKTFQLVCVNCGLNIINTKYGEGAVEAGSRTLNKRDEVVCDG